LIPMNWIEQKTLGLFVKTGGVLSKPFFSGKGFIIMLHRVLPEKLRNAYTLNRSLAITPEKLEEHILFFQKKGFHFISLDELYHNLNTGTKHPQKTICITLDDGYRDNYQYAYPVFKKLNVPATVYVTNCFPNGTALFWWYLFERHVKKQNELILPYGGEQIKYAWKTEIEGFAQFAEIASLIKKIPGPLLRNALKGAFNVTEDELYEECRTLALSWTELQQFAAEKEISIGAHTLNHVALKNQRRDLAWEEILGSKRELESKLDQPIDHFAYPYGGIADVGEREYKMVQEAGFKTAALNQPGNLFAAHKNASACLPRMPLGNETEPNKLAYYMNGIYHFSNNGFRKTQTSI